MIWMLWPSGRSVMLPDFLSEFSRETDVLSVMWETPLSWHTPGCAPRARVTPVHGVAFLWSVPLCCMWGVFSSVIVGKTRCRAGRPLGQTRNPASSYLIIMFLSVSVNKTQPLPRLGIGGVTVSQALCGKLIQCFQGAQKAWGVKMI